MSVGFAGALPSIRTHEVRGAPSAAAALKLMLVGSDYRAITTGPSSFRIEREPVHIARGEPRTLPPAPAELPEIVVTALKRPQQLSTLPGTARVVRERDLIEASGTPGSEQLSRQIPALTASSFGPGFNRLFLRGIGDGPLNGFNQGSVAILLDEARLNYDAPDPDWALIDIDQVEVLEGPQGPLYGTGALGGIVKISTNRPNLSQASAVVSAGVSVSEDSNLSNNQSLAANLPLISERLAVRLTGYHKFTDGWIDNAGSAKDSNSQQMAGGRLAIRWTPGDRWTVDVAGAFQNRRTRDSQYVDGNLGPFERADRLREPRDLDARNATLTVAGPIGRLILTSVTGASWQEIKTTYDATPLAAVLGTNGTTKVRDDRHYRVLDQEFRIRDSHFGPWSWLAGLSLVRASTVGKIVAEDPAAQRSLLALKRSVTEAALFGEATGEIGKDLTVSAGGRIFYIGIDDEGQEAQSPERRRSRTVRGAVDASVVWRPSSRLTTFVRAATGYRPGGINVEADATQRVYEADELASLEVGSRFKLSSSASFDTTVYAGSWQHVQADELLQNGLVATRNAGNALNVGIEADLRWLPTQALTLKAGIMVQSARLESAGRANGIDDPRLPAVPHLGVRAEIDHALRWGAWKGHATAGIRLTGATHLSFDPSLDRRTPGHSTADASVSLSRDGWTASLVGENLLNSSADTFAFGNPFRVRADPQRTPLTPRTIGLTVSRSF